MYEIRVFACLMVVFLTACGKGFDRSADFTSVEKYKEKIAQAASEATKEEIEAFDWAVSDQTIDSLKSKYTGKTFRQIALAELDAEISADQENIVKLEALRTQYDPIVAELLKVKAEVTEAGPSQDFFGEQFDVRVQVTNGSKLDYALVQWEALLFLEGGNTPVARAVFYDSYDAENGLRAGQTKARKFQPDSFFSKDWVTLAVRNAKTRRVELGIMDAKNFNNQNLLNGAPYDQLEKRKKALESAKKYKVALNN
ncbi:MAG: hypothetical protein PHD19_12510 [Dechloromonas sp.]|nr:hypothetical protein [Dechloromonas sp.]